MGNTEDKAGKGAIVGDESGHRQQSRVLLTEHGSGNWNEHLACGDGDS